MKEENQEQRHTQWRQLVEEQEKSGLSQKEFCNQQQLVLSKFVYYRCLLKKQDNILQKNTLPFMPVKVVNKEINIVPGEIKLSLPNGFQFSFPSHLDVAHIKRLAEALLSC